jgi:hypothetical protein
MIDSANKTSLITNYILNSNWQLYIIKYPNAGKEKVFIKVNPPVNIDCKDLLLKKSVLDLINV